MSLAMGSGPLSRRSRSFVSCSSQFSRAETRKRYHYGATLLILTLRSPIPIIDRTLLLPQVFGLIRQDHA